MVSQVMLALRTTPKASCEKDIDDVRDLFRNASVSTIYVSSRLEFMLFLPTFFLLYLTTVYKARHKDCKWKFRNILAEIIF